jgi:hypothetical protein
MTTLYESPTHRQDDIDCVVQCLGEIVDLQCGFPDGSLDDGGPADEGRPPRDPRRPKEADGGHMRRALDGAETL